jgi:membrane protein implicated in regulation of membrane protease activity
MNLPAELIWFLAGLVLILLEFAAPGVIVVFFGAGAWLTALTTWFGITPGLASQLIVWAVSSVLLLILLRRRLADRFHGFQSEDQDPHRNLDEDIGAQVVVTRDIDPDHREGRVEYKGAEWSALSPVAVAAGRLVEIVRADGVTLHVRPVEPGADNVASSDTSEGE